MHRDRIVHAGRDAVGVQPRPHAIALPNPDDELVIDWRCLAVVGRKPDAQRAQDRAVAISDATAPCVPVIQMGELYAEHGRLQTLLRRDPPGA